MSNFEAFENRGIVEYLAVFDIRKVLFILFFQNSGKIKILREADIFSEFLERGRTIYIKNVRFIGLILLGLWMESLPTMPKFLISIHFCKGNLWVRDTLSS